MKKSYLIEHNRHWELPVVLQRFIIGLCQFILPLKVILLSAIGFSTMLARLPNFILWGICRRIIRTLVGSTSIISLGILMRTFICILLSVCQMDFANDQLSWWDQPVMFTNQAFAKLFKSRYHSYVRHFNDPILSLYEHIINWRKFLYYKNNESCISFLVILNTIINLLIISL